MAFPKGPKPRRAQSGGSPGVPKVAQGPVFPKGGSPSFLKYEEAPAIPNGRTLRCSPRSSKGRRSAPKRAEAQPFAK